MAFDPKLSILTFPQKLTGDTLTLNVLIIPRNIDPTKPLVTGLGGGTPDAPAFQDANLQLQAKVISDLSVFPSDLAASTVIDLAGISIPATAKDVFATLQAQMNITITTDAAPAVDPNHFIKKYLPLSYRNAFNFTNPRVPEAVTDDSYQCAARSTVYNPGFVASDPTAVSWGQAFAHLLRQPDLARSVGFIQSSSITLSADMFKNGGWLYVDVAPTSDFYVQTQAEKSLIKKYAARIPALTVGNDRDIFAALQFPVLFKEHPADPDPTPGANYDQIFLEASEYDTGFAKIVHTYQPLNGNFMLEEEDPESLPRKDLGVRMGWDDEQLLIWQNRQMTEDPAQPGSGKRIDAPLGVSKYRVDVREAVPSGNPVNPWTSLAKIKTKTALTLGPTPISPANKVFELGTEVYPSQIDGNTAGNFWLPSYYTQWTGQSLVLPDAEAAKLNKTDLAGVQLQNLYDAVGLDKPGLYYGHIYDFRVRLADFTGGGPDSTQEPDPLNQGPAPVSTIHFKRYVAPEAVIFPHNPVDGGTFKGHNIHLKRPRLGYPAVVFTNKYTDPIHLLTLDSNKAMSSVAHNTPGRDFGLPDPDVDRVEITVEVKSLLMDNQLSSTGREAYILLYKTYREFPTDYHAALDIPVHFVDADQLSLGDPTNLDALGLSTGEIDTIKNLVLPTARDIRITMRAVCPADMNYFGSDLSYNGLPTAFFMRQESKGEKNLFAGTGVENQLQGIYLQPDADPVSVNGSTIFKVLLGDLNANNPPDLVQRLANQLGINNKGYTLVGQPGTQLQFGCSRHIRHSMSPDGSNMTISTKSDLLNHWVVAIKLILNRDWAWDALQTDSFLVQRIMKFKANGPITGAETPENIGYIRLGNSANMTALANANREQMELIFLDAVEPKPLPGNFPDIIELQYQVIPQFIAHTPPKSDPPLTLNLELPVTTVPAQIPILASAGIALSDYKSNSDYSATEAREKHLWLEFQDPPADPNDTFFIRLLNYAPDPLLSKITPELLANTQEPSLPIDPELIRVISSGNDTDDLAGLDAMQEMIVSKKSNRHFLIPLPPGLNAASNELFGMFTYEIRAGHSKIWSTAQGRFGRALRATGVQHPAPTLFCSVNRNEVEISVSAPHAVSVLNGKNITATPPRTDIWALLYAQVMQADGLSHRNILLDERMLINMKREQIDQNKQLIKINKDAAVYAVTTWQNIEVEEILAIMGLSISSSLSVVCVEMMPRPERYVEMPQEFADSLASESPFHQALAKQQVSQYMKTESITVDATSEPDNVNPLGEALGQFRILRTSPLTPVPFVCCT
jgi:hypothetical protein